MKLTGLYTTAGAQLAARAQAEGLSLVITRAAAGSMDSSVDDIAMARERQALNISSRVALDGKCTIMAELSASQSPVMYSLLEVGLYARLGDKDEVLYKLFRMDESLTIEPDTDLTVNFYLTETILQDDQVQVVITQQGLVTQEMCQIIAKAETQVVADNLTAHNTADDAHSVLFGSKAPVNHTHAASSISGGRMSGLVYAYDNVNYNTAQLRNIILSSSEPSGGVNGQVWIKYSA